MKNLSRKACIKIDDLPLRPQKVTPDEYEKIFGGKCADKWEDCTNTECGKCCSGLDCRGVSALHNGKCYPDNWGS
jgi:hypothetical protein